jgi:hypothetical protein
MCAPQQFGFVFSTDRNPRPLGDLGSFFPEASSFGKREFVPSCALAVALGVWLRSFKSRSPPGSFRKLHRVRYAEPPNERMAR